MAKLDQNFLKQIKDELKKRQQEYLQKRAELIESDPLRDPDHITANATDDDSREDQGHERVKALIAEIDLQLEEINQSLARLKAGNYGVCAVCGQEIKSERLRLFPWALNCIECERKEEL